MGDETINAEWVDRVEYRMDASGSLQIILTMFTGTAHVLDYQELALRLDGPSHLRDAILGEVVCDDCGVDEMFNENTRTFFCPLCGS